MVTSYFRGSTCGMQILLVISGLKHLYFALSLKSQVSHVWNSKEAIIFFQGLDDFISLSSCLVIVETFAVSLIANSL